MNERMEAIMNELMEIAKESNAQEFDYIWKMKDGKIATLKFEVVDRED